MLNINEGERYTPKTIQEYKNFLKPFDKYFVFENNAGIEIHTHSRNLGLSSTYIAFTDIVLDDELLLNSHSTFKIRFLPKKRDNKRSYCSVSIFLEIAKDIIPKSLVIGLVKTFKTSFSFLASPKIDNRRDDIYLELVGIIIRDTTEEEKFLKNAKTFMSEVFRIGKIATATYQGNHRDTKFGRGSKL